MKKYKIGVIALTVALILLVVGVYLYYAYSTVDIKKVDMYVNISDTGKLGINLNSDAIYFGTTFPGGVQKRWVNLENNYDFPIMVSISHDGDISPMVSVSENDFVMEPHTQKSVTYYCDTKDFPEGIYSGVTTVVFKRVFFK